MTNYMQGCAVKAAVSVATRELAREHSRPQLRDGQWRFVRFARPEEVALFDAAIAAQLDPDPTLVVDGIACTLHR